MNTYQFNHGDTDSPYYKKSKDDRNYVLQGYLWCIEIEKNSTLFFGKNKGVIKLGGKSTLILVNNI